MGQIIQMVFDLLKTNWVDIVAAVWLLEQLLRIISKITPTKFDDNLVDGLYKLLMTFFPKRLP